MQSELDGESTDLDIQIIGVNEINQEHGNSSVTDGRDIPWLQDVDLDENGRSDVTHDLWDTTRRDVVILDAEGEQYDVFNLTVNDLSVADNYAGLKQMLMDIATVESDPLPFQNQVDPHDVNDDGSVSPIDALLIINYLNSNGAGQLPAANNDSPYLDPTGDNFISPRDALIVINRLNSSSAASAIAARPAELSPDASSSSTAAAVDAAFASRVDLDDEFENDDDTKKKNTNLI